MNGAIQFSNQNENERLSPENQNFQLEPSGRKNIVTKIIIASCLFLVLLGVEFLIHGNFLKNTKNDPRYDRFSNTSYSSPSECKKQGRSQRIYSGWVGVCYGFFASQQNNISYCRDKGKEEFPGNQDAQNVVNSYCITRYAIDKKDCALCQEINDKFDTKYSSEKSHCFSTCSVLTNQKKYCELATNQDQVECKIFLEQGSNADTLLMFHIILTLILFILIIYAICRTHSLLLGKIVILGNGYIIIIGIGSLMIGLRGAYQDAAAPIMLFGLFGIAVALIMFNLIAVILKVIKNLMNK